MCSSKWGNKIWSTGRGYRNLSLGEMVTNGGSRTYLYRAMEDSVLGPWAVQSPWVM